MDWLTFDGVNWLGILVAFVASFALGWWWYSEAGFFPVWKRAGNITDEDMRNANMGAAFGGTIIGNVLGVIVLAILMNGLGVSGWVGGMVLGAVIGVVYRWGAHALHNGFALRHPRITLIDGLHDTVGLALAGVILGLFG